MRKKIIATLLLLISLVMYINLVGIENRAFAKSVNAMPKRYVNPIGRTIGLKLYTDGVLVVGMSEIYGADGKKYIPYENSGIKRRRYDTRNKWTRNRKYTNARKFGK